MLQAIGADERVQFPQAAAPESDSLARAVARFAGAMAKGNAREFGSFLAPDSRAVLDGLVADGRWDEGAAVVEAVRVVHMSTSMVDRGGMLEVNSAQFVLAIQEPGEAFTLGWLALPGGAGDWQFSAMHTSDEVKARASEWDSTSIAAYIAPSRPGRARPGAGGMDGMDFMADADPLTTYCLVEISTRILSTMGLPGMDRNTALAQMDPAQRAGYDSGKTEYDGGARPTGPQVDVIFMAVGVIRSMFPMMAMMGQGSQPPTDDQIAQIISDVIGMDVATAKARLAESPNTMPNLQDLLPPGMEIPEGLRPGPRPGTTRRNTPGGPIDVPTETPSDPGSGG